MSGPVAPNDAACAADTLRGGGARRPQTNTVQEGARGSYAVGVYVMLSCYPYSFSLWEGSGRLPKRPSSQYSMYLRGAQISAKKRVRLVFGLLRR